MHKNDQKADFMLFTECPVLAKDYSAAIFF